MSTPTIAKATDSVAQTLEQVAPTTSVIHDAGDITSSSALVTAAAVESPQFFQTVPDNEITHFLERFVELDTWSFAGTDTRGYMLNITPWDMFLAKTSVADKTANYSLIRGTLELLFVIMTQPSSYGSYVINALPNAGPFDASKDVNAGLVYNNCMQVDHYTRIDCASAENAVMQLPWVWPYDFADLPTGPTYSWIVNLFCLQPIQSGVTGAAASGKVRVFARLMPGYQLTVPRFQGGAHKGHLQPSTTTAQHMPAKHKELLKKSGKFSSAADTVGNIADKLVGVPVIGSMASTVSTAAHAASKLAHVFGFSRDTVTQTPTTVVNRSVTNLANYEGDDPSQVAAFSQSCEISTDPTLVGSTSEDILAFASLFSRWTLVKVFSWLQSTASGTDLGYIPVSPSYAMYAAGVAPDGAFNFTTAGYVGLPFSFWRGDMEYQIIIPTSKFHRGSLQIFWCPVGSTPTTDVTNTTLNMIFDLGSGEEHQITVGYARGKPYVNNEVLYDGSIINDDFTNGRLFFRVINPLTASNASANTSILVFARAAANMDFAVPRQNIQYGGAEYMFTTLVQLQGGALGDEDTHDMKTTVLVPSSGTFPGSELYFGETLSSVRALMQKPSRLWYQAPGGVVSTFNAKADFSPLGYLPAPNISQNMFAGLFNWQAWYRVLFTGIACSERVKLIPKQPRILAAFPVALSPLTTPGVGDGPVGTLAPATHSGAQYGAEFLIPYYRPEKFLLGRRFYACQISTMRYNKLLSSPATNLNGTDPAQEVAVYHSFGPDIRVVGFRGVPVVTTATTQQFAGVPPAATFFQT